MLPLLLLLLLWLLLLLLLLLLYMYMIVHIKLLCILLCHALLCQDGLRHALKSAFEDFINRRQSKPSELLAKYVDKKMRGEKGVDDGDVEAALDKVH